MIQNNTVNNKAMVDSSLISARKAETMQVLLKKLMPYLALIGVVMVFFFLTDGKLLTQANMLLVFKQSFCVLIAACAAIFVMATGNLDFSIGANVGFSCACACLAAFSNTAYALPIALVVGTIMGMITGSLHVIFKIPSIIACLCMSFILTASTRTLVGATNLVAPASMLLIETIPLLLCTAIGFVFVLFIIFEYTKVGKQLKAIGISPEAARQSGTNVNKMKILAYAFVGLACGLAGYFSLLRTGSASQFVGQTITTDVIIACVVGGMSVTGGVTARISAAVLGTFIISVINNGMILAGMGGEFPQLVKGFIFIIVVTATTMRSSNTIVK